MDPSKINAIKLSTVFVVLIIFLVVSFFTIGCKAEIEPAIETVIEVEEETVETIIKEDLVPTENKSTPEPQEDTSLKLVTGDFNMLSGLEISEGINNGRPLAVMVQNSPQARPHSGLIYADIVFEAVAESGVTRFVAFYSSKDAKIIGPVRSARIYFAEIARAFDPIYTFWGTYPDAYTAIKNMDMDVFDANSTAYVAHTSAGWRDPSRSGALEHTAFIDTYGIKKDSDSVGYSLEGGQSSMLFKFDSIESQRGGIDDITVDFSTENYRVGFSYDKKTNQYLRSLAGKPHVDFETGEQISLSNVAVLITDIEGPISSAGHMKIRTTGNPEDGKGYYFIDGNVIEGTWERKSIFDPFHFKDEKGNAVLFNRGSTWICMVQSIDRVLF